jgi:hypothetical protein
MLTFVKFVMLKVSGMLLSPDEASSHIRVLIAEITGKFG